VSIGLSQARYGRVHTGATLRKANTTSAQLTTHGLRPSSSSYNELSPRCFSGTLTRRSTFGTTTRDTNTMTCLHPHPHPSLPPPPTLQASTKSPSTRRRTRKSCPSYAGGSPCFASLARPSALLVPPPWCVAIIFLPCTMESSSTMVLC
jgi:hypothetical protein